MTSVKDFWEYWVDSRKKVLEIRIKDFDTIKKVAAACSVPYSSSGVYVNSYNQLLSVMKLCRESVTMWFGINPRKKAFKRFGENIYEGYGGKDCNVYSIDFIFIDIDRIDGEGMITEYALKKIQAFVGIILKELENINVKNYCVICSGNGYQIVIKLDEPIILPSLQFDSKEGDYIQNELFDRYKRLIKGAFGERLSKKFNTPENRRIYGCAIDTSGFNIGRVGALPYSFNLKYGKQLRYIYKLKDEEKNSGLSDALINELDNLDLPYLNNKTFDNNRPLRQEFKYKADTIVNSRLVQFILKTDLPTGMVNNWLIFQLKCLIQDNGISFNAPEIRHLQMMIEKRLKGKLPFNPPGKNCHFNPNVVNNYCIYNNLELLYEPLYDRPIVRAINLSVFSYANFLNWKLIGLRSIDIDEHIAHDTNKVEDLYAVLKIYERYESIITDNLKTRKLVDIIYILADELFVKYGEEDAKLLLCYYMPKFLMKKGYGQNHNI